MVEFTELIIKLPSNQWLVNLDSVGQLVKKLCSNQWLVNLDRVEQLVKKLPSWTGGEARSRLRRRRRQFRAGVVELHFLSSNRIRSTRVYLFFNCST